VKKSVVANFPDALARHLSHWGLTAPTKGVRAFAKWIYANPARCPGYRLSYEMFHAIQANLTDVPKDGDIPDLAYLLALPYVHYLTLDRRMYDYALRVSGKFSKANSAVDYKPRLFRSLKELLAII